jgi:hypothetical protein
MVTSFELEPTLEISLTDLYNGKLKGNPVWLSVSEITIKFVDHTWPRPGCEHGDVSPPSRHAIELARKALEPWGREHNLSDAWCIEWIVDNKLRDRQAQERGAVGVTIGMWVAPAPLKPIRFDLDLEGWRPEDEGRADFVHRSRAQFEPMLAQYCKKVEGLAIGAGYVLVPNRPQVEEHLAWLARHQVRHEAPAEIWKSLKAEHRNRSRRAVEKAIRETALLIGLTLRS